MLLRINSEITTLSKKNTNPVIQKQVEKLKQLRNELATSTLSGKVKKEQLNSLEEEINDAEMFLSQKITSFKRSKTEIIPKQVQQKLKPQQVLVDFLVYTEVDLQDKHHKQKQVIALIVDTEQIKLVKIGSLGEVSPLMATIKTYRENVEPLTQKKYEQGIVKLSPKELSRVAQQLYQQLWQPLEQHLNNKKTVYIIPDGILHLLPFKALQNSQGQYLGQQYQITRLASARDIVLPPLNAKTNESAIFANPNYGKLTNKTTTNTTRTSLQDLLKQNVFVALKGTQIEGDAIYKLMQQSKQPAKLYVQQNATELQISQVKAPKILHIATHGFYLENIKPKENKDSRNFMLRGENDFKKDKLIDNPLTRSGLAFSSANLGLQGKKQADGTDGILTALEVLALNLEGTELVTLSACETGVGQIQVGEGVYSLNRAFQEAGAKAVLSTLWNISDNGTQKFMQSFYQRFLNGISAQQSLQETQMEFIQSEALQDPYYWAAFVMTGIDANN